MTAEQPSVAALVERGRAALKLPISQDSRWQVEIALADALDALDSLTAALERAERERDEYQARWEACQRNAERHLARAQKAEAERDEFIAHHAKAEMALVKAEAVVEAAIAHVESLGYTHSARYLRELRDEPPTEQIPGAGQVGC